jgi:hypothetical protein
MSDAERLLAEAGQLEDQARTETLAKARELGMRAAELRMQVLGEKPYPVLVCSECFQLTGWLGSGDRCDVCISSARREASFENPGGSWVSLATDASAFSTQRASAWKRLAAKFGASAALDKERTTAWNAKVDPGETGPFEPEDGFELFGAERGESAAPEGVDLLVRFWLRAYRFENHAWQQIIRTGGPVPLTPDVFPASLPIDQIAEAWNDYCDEVRRHGAAAWAAECERREGKRQAAQSLADARSEQRGTSGLLDE